MADKQTPRIGQGKPGPGRPKGSENKLTRTVKEAVELAFNELQDDKDHKLVAWAKKNPTDFYKIAAKLIPAAVEGSIEHEHRITKITREIVRTPN